MKDTKDIKLSSVKVAPIGTSFSKELASLFTIHDKSGAPTVEVLSEMRVAPTEVIFLVEPVLANFISNNREMLDISITVVHPIDDNIEVYSPVWTGLENFNDVVKEEELIATMSPLEKDEDDEVEGSRFNKQYARVTKNKSVKPLLHPTYTKEELDLDTDEDESADL